MFSRRLSKGKPIHVAFMALAVYAIGIGCAAPPPPYVPAYQAAVTQAHCFDGVPHQQGSRPWVLGGTCCCTPTDELMAAYHRDGFCTDLDTEALIALYHERGVQLGTDHHGCNNQCSQGPHVAKGGKCMVPPRPGTRNYQEVVTGVVLVAATGPAK